MYVPYYPRLDEEASMYNIHKLRHSLGRRRRRRRRRYCRG
jgi:hypothetical protein